MMQIEFVGTGHYDAARDAVAIPVALDGQRMVFFVARSVLENQFGADGDPARTFNANRLEIEMMVRLRIQAGARGGTVLTAADF